MVKLRSYTLSIDDLSSVAKAAEGVRELCEGFLGEESLHEVEIGIVEALNNVLLHGHGGQRRPVQLISWLEPDRLVIEIVDQGIPMEEHILDAASLSFDPDDISKLPEGGFGLPLVKSTMDEVEYRSEGALNRLRLIKLVDVGSSYS